MTDAWIQTEIRTPLTPVVIGDGSLVMDFPPSWSLILSLAVHQL